LLLASWWFLAWLAPPPFFQNVSWLSLALYIMTVPLLK
jgi:hypothetical protein